jgi:hypothetical protein
VSKAGRAEPGDTWPVDDTWQWAEDDSLEAYVRSWVKERTKAAVAPTMTRVAMRYFPVEVHNAMEYVHHTAEVEAYDREGDLYVRRPSYSEVYVGTALAGLHALAEMNVQAPSRLARLQSDETQSTLRRPYLFHCDGILQPNWQGFIVRLPERLVGQARDIADALSVHTSTIVVACFVAGIARSEEWLLPVGPNRSRWIARCSASIKKFLQYMATERGLA